MHRIRLDVRVASGARGAPRQIKANVKSKGSNQRMETTRLNKRVSSEKEAETTDAVDTIAFCSHQLLRLCASSDRARPRREDLPPDFLEFRRIFTAST